MLLRIARGFLTLIGAAIGAGIAYLVVWTLKQFNIILIPHYQDLLIYLISGTGFAIIFFMLSSKVIQFTIKSVKFGSRGY
jgi:phosphate/sulfate permease